MNTKKANISSLVITSDDEAKQILKQVKPKTELGLHLLRIAKLVSKNYSFVDNQTYPRPNHPLTKKRLPPEFTFMAIIVSLRCTLETEQKVVNQIINLTNGDCQSLWLLDDDKLRTMLKPSGLADRKTVWIKEGLHNFRHNQNYQINNLKNISDQELRHRLLALKGMGPKATDCFMLLGLERPMFPIDVNVFKVISAEIKNTVFKDIKPDFSNKQHVSGVKAIVESSFDKDVKLFQVLHTYILLAGKHKVSIL